MDVGFGHTERTVKERQQVGRGPGRFFNFHTSIKNFTASLPKKLILMESLQFGFTHKVNSSNLCHVQFKWSFPHKLALLINSDSSQQDSATGAQRVPNEIFSRSLLAVADPALLFNPSP